MFYETMGLIGMAMILLGFLMNQFGKWKSDDLVYDAVNAVGSLLLTAYALAISSTPFAVLNGIWAIVSMRDVLTDVKKGQKFRVFPGHKPKVK